MFYDKHFYDQICTGSSSSAKKLVPYLIDNLKPSSVIDFGCGIGTWLYEFKKNGCSVFGLDGNYVDRNMLMIDKSEFKPTNLEERVFLDKRYDLAISLEVAEHLSENRAQSFVADLAQASDIVLFSAAFKGQGGNHHINEQHPKYWIEKFKKEGLLVIDCIRGNFYGDQEIEWWYRNNSFLFVKEDIFHKYKHLHSDEAHFWIIPDAYIETQKAYKKLSNYPPIKTALKIRHFIKSLKSFQ